MAFELSKLSLYILIMLSFAFQTTARRAQILPLPNNNTTTATVIPASNDTEPLLTNDNSTANTTTPTDTNDINPTLTPIDTNDIKPTPTDTNDTKPISLGKTPQLSPQYFAPSPNSQEAAKTTNDFFTPDIQYPTLSSPPPYIASSPYPQETAKPTNGFFTPNGVVYSPKAASPPAYVENNGAQNGMSYNTVTKAPPPMQNDNAQNDMSFYSPLEKAPAPAPAATVEDDSNISPSSDSSDSGNPPTAPAIDDSSDYNIEVAPAPALVVLPSTYEADVEVDPELLEEMKAYTESEEDDEHQARMAVVVAGAICLVGVGGLLYKKRKNDTVKKSQYQYLNKMDHN